MPVRRRGRHNGPDFGCQHRVDPLIGAAIMAACDRYLQEGGFPESVDIAEATRVRLHQEYFSTVLQRDLILRNDSPHPAAVRDLALKLMQDNACLHSVNRLAATLS